MRSEIFALDRTQSIASLVGRVLMSGLFFYSALGKILEPQSVITRIAEAGLPLPQVGYAASVFIEAAVGPDYRLLSRRRGTLSLRRCSCRDSSVMRLRA